MAFRGTAERVEIALITVTYYVIFFERTTLLSSVLKALRAMVTESFPNLFQFRKDPWAKLEGNCFTNELTLRTDSAVANQRDQADESLP